LLDRQGTFVALNMGEGQSKPTRSQQSRAVSTKTSVATGDIKSEDLTSLRDRCAPKALRSSDGYNLQAEAPVAVAAPAAAKPANQQLAQQARATNTAGGGFYGMPAAPFIAGPPPGSASIALGALQPPQVPQTPALFGQELYQSLTRGDPLMRTVPHSTPVLGQGAFPRSDSMIRTMTMPQGTNFQRSSSMVRAQGAFPRSDSLVLAPQQGAFPRSDSLIRASQQAGQIPVGIPMQRSSSMVRTSAQQQQVLQPQPTPVPSNGLQRTSSMLVQMPPGQAAPQMLMPTTHAPSLVPVAMQPTTYAPSLVPPAMQPTTRAPSLVPASMQHDNLLASRTMVPTTHAPSMIPAPMQQRATHQSTVAPTGQAPSSVPPSMGQQLVRRRSPSPKPMRASSVQFGMPPTTMQFARSPSMMYAPPPKLEQMRATDYYQRMYAPSLV